MKIKLLLEMQIFIYQMVRYTSSEWIDEDVEKLVYFLQSSMQRLLLFRRDPFLTPPVFRKLMTSCISGERNLK